MLEDDAILPYAGITRGDIAAVIDMTRGSDITELRLRVGPAAITVRRDAAALPADELPQLGAEPESPAELDPVLTVRATLVGVFRSSVSVGQVLAAGAPIGAVEALGMPTSITVEEAGSVAEILVADGNPVEYGQPLLVLRRGTP